MVLEAPLFMQGNTYAARRLRELVGFIFDVEGVVKPETNALKVSPRAAGATMSVDVAAGTCAIRGDDQAAQGMYLCSSTEVANKPIGPAPGSGSRIDLVYAQLRDAAVTGGTASDWIIEVLPGDAVPSNPVPKAVPASAIPLAEVLVTSTTTSITGGITDRRTAATNAAYEPIGTSGLVKIAEVTLASPGSISFTSIPADYRHLVVEFAGWSTRVAADDTLFMRLNGDTAANYDWQSLSASAAAVSAAESLAATLLTVGVLPAANGPAGAVGTAVIDLPLYRSTGFHKGVVARGGTRTSTASGGLVLRQHMGAWRNTAAVMSILLGAGNASLGAGSVATLYGLKGT